MSRKPGKSAPFPCRFAAKVCYPNPCGVKFDGSLIRLAASPGKTGRVGSKTAETGSAGVVIAQTP